MENSRTGFAVIYRWRIRAGTEEEFREAWDTVTRALMEDRGALGSRLHLAEDGFWTAYAQWPSREAWERARGMDSTAPEASALMKNAVVESLPPLLLQPVSDHLVKKGIVDQ